MTAGRPRAFDEDWALERAMELFWKRGYEATTIQDLLEAMQINRSSMYETFGDKESLFVRALEHYIHTVRGPLLKKLGHPGPPASRIRRMMLAWVDIAGAEDGRGGRGCLLTNTTVDGSPGVGIVAASVQTALAGVEQAIFMTLNDPAEGRMLPVREIKREAHLLFAVLQGINVLSRMGAPRIKLRGIVEASVSRIE